MIIKLFLFLILFSLRQLLYRINFLDELFCGREIQFVLTAGIGSDSIASAVRTQLNMFYKTDGLDLIGGRWTHFHIQESSASKGS